jgi:hypothetical protein
MANGIEYIFMDFFAICKMSPDFLIQLLRFLMLSLEAFLYILDTSLLPDIWPENIFSIFIACILFSKQDLS